MGDVVQLFVPLMAIMFPFIAMVLMWRRMKRVRNGAYRAVETPSHQPAWEEALRSENGLQLARSNSPNDELIDLGAKAHQTHWPVNTP